MTGMDAVPDTHLMAAAEQRARQWLEGRGIETAQLDFLAEDILRLVGELRDLRRESMSTLQTRVAELESAVDYIQAKERDKARAEAEG